MNNSGIILVLAYPETIVRLAIEWYSPLLRIIGLGKKGYIRAGHAALVLINKETKALDYYDFGRYITPGLNGRVRSKETDCELDFPLKADVVDGKLKNTKEILHFLGVNPELTHGDGDLYASVCNEIDYDLAKKFIFEMQETYFIRYAAFKKGATNCARFVTDTIIASTTNDEIRERLIESNKFTPSTLGNTVLSDTEKMIYIVSQKGEFSEYTPPKKWHNIKANAQFFIDRLKGHSQSFEGTTKPKKVEGVAKHAQWLGGIGSGAWFELSKTNKKEEFRFRRISPYRLDTDAIFNVNDLSFDYDKEYMFNHESNCSFCHIKQGNKIFRFDFVRKFDANSVPLEHSA